MRPQPRAQWPVLERAATAAAPARGGDVLFLCHRIPYPPNKGDKIRSWNVLGHLARTRRVHVAGFIDDAADFDHVARLREAAGGDVFFTPRMRWRRLGRSALGLLRGQALSVACFADSRLRRWVAEAKARHAIENVYVFSSSMAPYALDAGFRPERCIFDMVDVDSEKWRTYAEQSRLPMSWVYRREAGLLLAEERRAAAVAAATLLVSRAEAELFAAVAPEARAKIKVVENGVDLAYFDPQRSFPSPFAPEDIPLVFTGAMDYRPNVEACEWFARTVMPPLLARVPGLRFFVVGANPAPAVTQLERLGFVKVTGRVPDIRPWLAHARVAVVPLLVARGIQNKVLEAMAMACPVVATPVSVAALDVDAGRDLLVAGTSAAFAESVLSIVENPAAARSLSVKARSYVARRRSWPAMLERLDEIADATWT